jgi:phage repressor protein C with HTH and peptisase S24 domain
MNALICLPIAAVAVASPFEMKPSAATVVEKRRRTGVDDKRFCATINNDVMSPRYDAGETVIFNKSLRPQIGDDVLIVRRTEKGDGGLIRRLVGFDGTNLRLKQYKPSLEIELPINEVAEIYPCVTYEAVVFSAT